jgi:hypothetical protein
MYTRYHIQRDIAVTNRPTGDVVYANDYIVNWGQRGRAGSDNIKPRANFVVQRVLPELDHTAIIDNLPQPIEMISGKNWVKNLILGSAAKTMASELMIEQRVKVTPVSVQQTHYFHKALPKH